MQVLVSEIREMFNGFTDDEWDKLNKQLVHFCKRKYGGEHRLSMRGLIQGAISDVYEGRRHWPEDVSLVQCLRSAIRSEADHILRRENVGEEKRHRFQPIEDSELELLKKTDGSAYLQLCVELRDLVKGRPLLEVMVEIIILDYKSKPGDMLGLIRERVPGVSMASVYKAYGHLKQVIRELKEQEKEQENVQDS
jgi:hypothetical protein